MYNAKNEKWKTTRNKRNRTINKEKNHDVRRKEAFKYVVNSIGF